MLWVRPASHMGFARPVSPDGERGSGGSISGVTAAVRSSRASVEFSQEWRR